MFRPAETTNQIWEAQETAYFEYARVSENDDAAANILDDNSGLSARGEHFRRADHARRDSQVLEGGGSDRRVDRTPAHSRQNGFVGCILSGAGERSPRPHPRDREP